MSYIGGLYTGLKYVGALVNNSEQVTAVDEYLKLLTKMNRQDSVVSIYMIPTRFYSSDDKPTIHSINVNRPTTLNGYTPRNNKLFTYPYCFLTVDCINDSKNYRYEFSGIDGKIQLMLCAGMSPNVEIICCPVYYNGSGNPELDNSVGINYTEELVMTGFPQCAYTVDSYRAWLSQKAAGDIIGIGASVLSGNVAGSVQQTVGTVIEATKGSTSRGTQGSSTLTSVRAKDFYLKCMCVTQNYAKMIDDYFDRFGYALERITAPNRSSRPHWNYVQTKDCTIRGSIPADDMNKICSIYDKGITFWKNGSEVGNYKLDNSPTD